MPDAIGNSIHKESSLLERRLKKLFDRIKKKFPIGADVFVCFSTAAIRPHEMRFRATVFCYQSDATGLGIEARPEDLEQLRDHAGGYEMKNYPGRFMFQWRYIRLPDEV